MQRISESHPQARGFAVDCDVTNVADRKRLVEKSVEFARTVPGNSGGFLHRVFLNQGISQNSKFEELAEETEVEMMEVNFFANVRLTRLLVSCQRRTIDQPDDFLLLQCLITSLPQCQLPILTSGANASSDTILRPRLTYVASALARLPAPYNTIYCASKSALCTFFDCLRYEVPFKIVGVLPGPVRTEMIGKLRGPRGQIVEMVVDDPSVVQRATRSDDVKGKLPESVIMSASEAARLAALATEREVREVTYPPLDRAMAKVRFGNAEGQEVWDGPRSVGDTMQRM